MIFGHIFQLQDGLNFLLCASPKMCPNFFLRHPAICVHMQSCQKTLYYTYDIVLLGVGSNPMLAQKSDPMTELESETHIDFLPLADVADKP